MSDSHDIENAELRQAGDAPLALTTTAPDVAPATAPPHPDEAMINRFATQVTQEFDRLSNNLKLYLPFIVLLLVKFLINHLVSGLMLLLLLNCIFHSRDLIKDQLALKTHMNIKILASVLVYVSVLIVSACITYEYMGYSEDVASRLLFIYGAKHSNNNSIWSVLWNCWLTDIFVQLVVIWFRAVICLLTATNQMRCVRNLTTNCFHRLKKCGQRMCSSIIPSQSSSHGDGCAGDDLEAAESASSSSSSSSFSRPTHNHDSNASHFHRPNDGLLSRRTSASVDTSRQSSELGEGQAVDDDRSDKSDLLSADIYFTRQLCNLLDILGYFYRTILPLPLWVDNLSATAVGQSIFPLFYLTLKFTDLSWKLKGCIEAVEFFLGQKLEYGRYTTREEYNERLSNYDCPICYDSPNKAVILSCQHIFCEHCIGEWLEKEKTCPVCRVEVQCTAKSLGAMKKEALGYNQIIM